MDKFCVMEGKQVMFSSDDEDLCKGMATQKRLDLINRGVDIRSGEHAVTVINQSKKEK